MIKKSFLFIIGAGLLACSSYKQTFVKTDLVSVTSNSNPKMDSLIRPYRDSMSREMDEVIAFSNQDFGTSRPSISMNNWVSDAIYLNQLKQIKKKEPVICLLNSGGIRSTLLKGNITIGDIYKVMPFDNSIVWVQMPVSIIPSIEKFLSAGKNQPISGAVYENGKLKINQPLNKDSLFWIITSDYLSNGNDGMTFFNSKTKVESTTILMRNSLIEESKIQQKLIFDSINRMKF